MYNWLQAICNTCLIASKEELGKMIDYPSLKDNDLSKKFKTTDGNLKEFLIRSTFHEFEHKVSEDSDGLIALSEWLDKYKKASEEYKKRITFWNGKAVKEKQESLLDYILFSHIIDDIHKYNWKKDWYEEERKGVDLEILLLISLRILPFYSGKGEAEDEPVSVLLKFLNDFFNGTGELFENICQLLNEHKYKNSRINSVTILRKIVKQIKNISKPEYPEELFNKAKSINVLTHMGLQNNADQDILWTDGINLHVFYKFDFHEATASLYKYDIRKKIYTRYIIAFFSVHREKYGTIINPQFIIPALMKNYEDALHYTSTFAWKFDKNSISFSIIESPYTKLKEWVNTFRKLKLTRIDEKNDSSYNSFMKSLNKKSFYENEYPETEYLFIPTLHSITYDNCVIVNDIKKNGEGEEDFIRDTDTEYKIDSKWFGDERNNIDTPIGVIILNYKDNPEQWEKYIFIPLKNLSFPIINGEVVFPDDPI